MKIKKKKTLNEKISNLLKQNMEKFRSNVKRLLIEKHITPTELAYAMDKEPSFVFYVLSNRHSNISIETVTIIQNTLGVELKDLIN